MAPGMRMASLAAHGAAGLSRRATFLLRDRERGPIGLRTTVQPSAIRF
jgi:hypothetical protein